MVALAKISKVEAQAVSDWRYLCQALDSITVDEDARGPYARIQSQSGDFKHQVRFVEPQGEVPHATRCTCTHFKCCKACCHCEILDIYYQIICGVHGVTNVPVVVEEKEAAASGEREAAAVASEMLENAQIEEASQNESEVIMPEEQSIWQRPDNRLYRVWVNGNVIYCYWSEMKHYQKARQLAFEQDAEQQRLLHVEMFYSS